jgi:hypothetical protein
MGAGVVAMPWLEVAMTKPTPKPICERATYYGYVGYVEGAMYRGGHHDIYYGAWHGMKVFDTIDEAEKRFEDVRQVEIRSVPRKARKRARKP